MFTFCLFMFLILTHETNLLPFLIFRSLMLNFNTLNFVVSKPYFDAQSIQLAVLFITFTIHSFIITVA